MEVTKGGFARRVSNVGGVGAFIAVGKVGEGRVRCFRVWMRVWESLRMEWFFLDHLVGGRDIEGWRLWRWDG